MSVMLFSLFLVMFSAIAAIHKMSYATAEYGDGSICTSVRISSSRLSYKYPLSSLLLSNLGIGLEKEVFTAKNADS